MIIIVNDNAQLVVYAPINTAGSFCISVVNLFLFLFFEHGIVFSLYWNCLRSFI